MGFKVEELEREADQDPYAGRTILVARTLGELLNDPGSSQSSSINSDFVAYGENLWRKACGVLLWWTPSRIEAEALRRAGDEAGPSTIAQEHHLFLAVYLRWSALLWGWAPHVQMGNVSASDSFTNNLYVRRALMLKDSISELLAGLERKAAAAEARAMDIRLRVDHHRIAQLIAGQELVSHLQQLVEIASQSLANEEHLKRVATDLLPHIESAAQALGSIENAADYACDKLARLQPEKRTQFRVAAAAVMTASVNAATKFFLDYVIHLLVRVP